MIDTVTLRRGYAHSVPSEVERNFTFTGERYFFNPKPVKNCALPSLTWSAAPNGINYLSARVSVPKMLYGTNTLMVTDSDIGRALNGITDFTSSVAGVDFNAATANVARLDISYNFKVGEAETYAYLSALQKAFIPRLTTRRIINDGTVEFSNDSQKVCVYAKHAETAYLAKQGKATDEDVRRAVGDLRIEHRFLNSPALKRLATRLKCPDRHADSLLQSGVAETVMNDTIMSLGLDKAIESGDSRLALLRERYGYGSTYQRLAGFLALCDEHGADNLVRLGIVAERTFYRQRGEVEKARAWLVSPVKKTLPPLRLVRSNVMASFAIG
jgi:replication protein CRI